jgi:hypothetical protein
LLIVSGPGSGLSKNPYVDEAAVPGKTMQPADVAAARTAAARSMVLLKNQNNALPAVHLDGEDRRGGPARRLRRPARPVVGHRPA